MKKLLLIFCILGIGKISLAQTNTFPSTGNVGIGTASPSAKLHIFNGDVYLGTDTYYGQNDQGRRFRMYQNDNGSPYLMLGASYSAVTLTTTFSRMRIDGAYLGALVFEVGNGSILDGNGDPSSFTEAMRITSVGNIGIGTSTPSEKLSVNGKIRAKEIKVETANWPDYVFAKDYQLPSLQEIEQQIKETGHLPGIPLASEVKANGIDLGEMNAKLLQKIEELTLYLIEKDKQVADLQKRMKVAEGKNQKK